MGMFDGLWVPRWSSRVRRSVARVARRVSRIVWAENVETPRRLHPDTRCLADCADRRVPDRCILLVEQTTLRLPELLTASPRERPVRACAASRSTRATAEGPACVAMRHRLGLSTLTPGTGFRGSRRGGGEAQGDTATPSVLARGECEPPGADLQIEDHNATGAPARRTAHDATAVGGDLD